MLFVPAVLSVLFFSVFLTAPGIAAENIRISVSGSYNMIFLAAGVAHHKGVGVALIV